MKAKLLHRALEKNLKFVVYREPGDGEVRFIGETISSPPANGLPREDQSGFMFCPFDERKHDMLWINAEYDGILNGDTRDFEKFISSASPLDLKSDDTPVIIEEHEYLATLHKAMNRMEDEGVEKFVFSRIERVPYSGQLHAWSIFSGLCEKYPDAFVYLFNHPGSGTWIGATPETLLIKNGDKLLTVALAGTRPVAKNKQYEWGQKEVEEQEYVSEYIEELLKDYKMTYRVQGPQTIEAGPVAHLNSVFHITDCNAFDDASKLLPELHPTPAVCGFPKEEAREFILKTESHRREYYTGFLGPADGKGNFKAYVNLRCMKVTDENLYLFLGGGITADSSPEAEWKETRLKAETLKAVL